MLIPELRRMTQSDPSYLYFEYKSELLDEMESVYNEIRNERSGNAGKAGLSRKILVILGSSRLLYFDYESFERTYPDWELFNFSGPVTTPAYYSYMLERIFERGIVPDYVVMEADPFQFNEGSDAFRKSNLGYSFDLAYIFSHFNLFTRDEVSYYLARTLFLTYKYPPDISNYLERRKDPMNRHALVFNMVEEHQTKNRGCGRSLIPKQDWYERDFARLEASSRKTVRWLYGNYTLSDRQFTFLDMALDASAKKNVPLLLVRPQVSRPMTRMLRNDERIGPALEEWEKRLSKLREEKDTPFIDFGRSEDYYCNTYVDGAHMSLDCYGPFMQAVMLAYPEARRSVDM